MHLQYQSIAKSSLFQLGDTITLLTSCVEWLDVLEEGLCCSQGKSAITTRPYWSSRWSKTPHTTYKDTRTEWWVAGKSTGPLKKPNLPWNPLQVRSVSDESDAAGITVWSPWTLFRLVMQKACIRINEQWRKLCRSIVTCTPKMLTTNLICRYADMEILMCRYVSIYRTGLEYDECLL